LKNAEAYISERMEKQYEALKAMFVAYAVAVIQDICLQYGYDYVPGVEFLVGADKEYSDGYLSGYGYYAKKEVPGYDKFVNWLSGFFPFPELRVDVYELRKEREGRSAGTS